MVTDGAVKVPADVAKGSIDVVSQTMGRGEGSQSDQGAQQSVFHNVLATFIA